MTDDLDTPRPDAEAADVLADGHDRARGDGPDTVGDDGLDDRVGEAERPSPPGFR